MTSTATMLEESILASQQQKSAADQVAAAIAQIREAAYDLTAKQEQREGATTRVEELVSELNGTLAGYGAAASRPTAVETPTNGRGTSATAERSRLAPVLPREPGPSGSRRGRR